MPFQRMLPLLLMFLVALVRPVAASDPEQSFQQARKGYESLLAAEKKKLYRENWDRVIDRLLVVAKDFPRHRRAPEALFLAGKAGEGLYAVSQVKDDALRATKLYANVANEYPDSTLADDALARAALLEEAAGELARAYGRYDEVVKRYPKGDQAAAAKRKLAALARHAPPPPKPAPKPVATAAAASERVASSPAASAAPPAAATAGAALTSIRFWSNPGYTRVVIELSGNVDFTTKFLPGDGKGENPPRLYLDIAGAVPAPGVAESTAVDDGLLRRIRAGRPEAQTSRVVLDLHSFRDYKVFSLPDPYRIVIDIAGDRPAELKAASAEVRSLPPGPKDGIARVLEQVPEEKPLKVRIPPGAAKGGLRRIVVDAGHGGKDPGAIGPSGVQEKQVVLAMAKALAGKLEEELGCEVLLTRSDDTFLPLEERTAIANKVGADLFISIHANAAPNRDAHGIETYYLNFAKSDKAAAVVARENGTSLKQVSDLELILFDLMANSKINESSHLANEIQKSLVDSLGRHYPDVRDLGVRQGPFYVLLGATMPSVLVETAFISHHREETRLTDAKYHERTAAAIAEGVRSYATALKLIASQ